MPAKSEKQRRLMAAARAYKRGEYKGEPSDEIKRLAESMSDEDLTDFMKKEATDINWKGAAKGAATAGIISGIGSAALSRGNPRSAVAGGIMGLLLGGGLGAISEKEFDDMTEEERAEYIGKLLAKDEAKKKTIKKSAALIAKVAKNCRKKKRRKVRERNASKYKSNMTKLASLRPEDSPYRILEDGIYRGPDADDDVEDFLVEPEEELIDPEETEQERLQRELDEAYVAGELEDPEAAYAEAQALLDKTAFQRVDDAVDVLVKEASGPMFTNKDFKKKQQEERTDTAPTEKELPSGAFTQGVEPRMDILIKELKGMRREVREATAGARAARRIATDPKVMDSIVPGKLASGLAGGGMGAALTYLFSKGKGDTLDYLLGTSAGAGLGVLGSMAAKGYGRKVVGSMRQGGGAV